MNSQNILIHRLEHFHLSPGVKQKLKGIIDKQASHDPQKSGSGNYLPGLRPVESETEAYFNNDFVWRGF